VTSFDGLPVIDSVEVCLKPLRISAEESHLMYVLGILPFFGAAENVPVEVPLPGRLTPIYVRRLQIESTYLLLSVAARRVIHADCNDVRVNITSVDVRNSECFPVTLARSLLDQYISDAVAAVPLVLASISLLGCPLNIVRAAIDGIKSSWAMAFHESDSVLMGIGRGSMNIIRGITKGSLESFVRLTGSLEETIKHLTETSGQETARMGFQGIGQGLLEMVVLPTTVLLSLFRRTGRFVLRGVARPDEERWPEVSVRRPLAVLDLAENRRATNPRTEKSGAPNRKVPKIEDRDQSCAVENPIIPVPHCPSYRCPVCPETFPEEIQLYQHLYHSHAALDHMK
jgi:hypothetical protein